MNLVPFHYPGGKVGLKKLIIGTLAPHMESAKGFNDSYTGGGCIALEIAWLFRKIWIILNDRNPEVAAFWRICVGSGYKEFARLIRGFVITPKSFRALGEGRYRASRCDMEMALCHAILTRLTWNGVSKGGVHPREVQRYNADRLAEKIERIHDLLASRTEVFCEDAVGLIKRLQGETVIYADPPYPRAGKVHYRCSMSLEAHRGLANALRERTGGIWLLSNEDLPGVRRLYADFRTDRVFNPKSQKTELLIMSDSLAALHNGRKQGG